MSSMRSVIESVSSCERYVNWINRVLSEAGKTSRITALNDDGVCNGRVLFDVFEYISRSPVTGYVNVRSQRAVLYNLQILLNKIAGLKIRMSLIQPIDIQRGDVPTIQRFVLGLIRHYQPQFVRPKGARCLDQGPTVRQTGALLSRPTGTPSIDSSNRLTFNKSPFRSKLHRCTSRTHSSADSPGNSVTVTDRRMRHLSETSTLYTDTIPRDIQEIHVQLRELKTLLSRPDIINESLERRDISCQTTKADLNFEHLLKQKDCLIANQQDQLNNLKVTLENKTRIAETFAKELSILRTQQSRRNLDIEPKILDQFISLLKSIRLESKLDNCDLDKFDEGINMITSLSLLNRTQLDKANVAIITPCSKTVADDAKDDSFPNLNLPLNREESLNPFLTDSKNILDRQETKLIFFIGKSPIPYSSVIPIQSVSITLAKVKECTQSLLSKDCNFRYFFKSITKDFGATKEEIIRDSDRVPIIDGKIVVFIQQ